jgi:hypothetical protein
MTQMREVFSAARESRELTRMDEQITKPRKHGVAPRLSRCHIRGEAPAFAQLRRGGRVTRSKDRRRLSRRLSGFWGAHAPSRADFGALAKILALRVNHGGKVRDHEGVIASTRGACAPR